MDIKIITEPISLKLVQEMAEMRFGDMTKASVDVERKVIALGGDLHADEEQILLENGSQQKDIWGINLYPEHFCTDQFIEFDSMINLRPSQGNRSRGVEDPDLQQKIRTIISTMIPE
jgi:hypothetical protein